MTKYQKDVTISEFKGKDLVIVDGCDFDNVRENAHYLLVCEWNPGEVAKLRWIGDKWLEEIHESWFYCADKGTAGCWIANEQGQVIAQMAHYAAEDIEEEACYMVANANSTGQHSLDWD